jgi:YVTN family beta-propeller protein
MCIAPAAAKEYLYIHNTNSGEISKIAIPEHEVVAEIQIGKYMDYITKSPDNKTVYVNRINGDMPGSRAANIGTSGEIIAIDAKTDEIKWRLDMDGMTHHMSVSKDGKRMFVPYYDTWWLAVVDLEKREIIKKIFVGHGGHGTKVSDDGKRLYVGSMMNDALIVIDTQTLEVIDRYGFRDGVRPFAIAKDESVIYVQQSWLHGFIVVDTKTRKQSTIKLPDFDLGVPEPQAYPHNVNHGIGLTPDESELWVNGSALDFVAVYSHPDLKLKTTIPIGKDPNSLTFNGDGSYIYISNRKEDTLSIIDTKTKKEIKRLKLGQLPQRMVVVDIPE